MLRPRSEQTYAGWISRYESWLGARTNTIATMREYLDTMQKGGKSNNTLMVIRNALKHAYGIALPSYRMQLREPKYLHIDDIKRAIGISRPMEKTIITLCFDTGCRISEILELTTDDIDWEHGVITVTRKGGQIARVGVTDTGMSSLRSWLDMRKCSVKRVFMDYDYQSVYYSFRKLSRELGIYMTPHVLRHSRIVHLLESGVPIERVGEIAGHKRLDTTAKIYGRLRAEEVRDKYLKAW